VAHNRVKHETPIRTATRARSGDRSHITPALVTALVNLGVGFLAVGLATFLGQPQAAKILMAACTPALAVVTLFFALSDLFLRQRGDEGRVAAWLALCLTLAPLLVLFLFLRDVTLDRTPRRTLSRLGALQPPSVTQPFVPTPSQRLRLHHVQNHAYPRDEVQIHASSEPRTLDAGLRAKEIRSHGDRPC
jgi:hypothetical protein